MVLARRASLLAGAACLALFAVTAFAQQSRWDTLSAAGVKAYGERRLLEAEELFEDALTEAKASGAEDARLANSLMNLAHIKKDLAKFEDAESLFSKALAIREKVLGPEHPAVANSLNELGMFFYQQTQPQYLNGKRTIIVDLFVRENMRPDFRSLDHDQILKILIMEKFVQAESLLRRALTIREKILPQEHEEMAVSSHNLGEVLRAAGKYGEAEPLLRRGLAIREKIRGPEDPRVADSSLELAELYRFQKRFAEAEPFYQRALAIREKTLGQGHFKVAEACEAYAELFKETNRLNEARKMEARAKRILTSYFQQKRGEK